MKRLLYLIIISIAILVSSCKYTPGTFEYVLTLIGNMFERTYSIEKDGLEGVDTCAFPGDKEQIASSIIANIDTIWVQMRDSLNNHPDLGFSELYKTEDFLYDPTGAYSVWTFQIDPKSDSHSPIWKRYKFLSDRPSTFYNAYTDLIVYNKDKLLCWAFVIIEQHKLGGTETSKVPYYCGYNVIGKRNTQQEPFRVFIRNRTPYPSYEKGWEERMENDALYIPGYTYDVRDVYEADEDKLPVVSDPDFFEKHPLFHKFNDSTYNFEWYIANKFGHAGEAPVYRPYK